jgi:hypothetical protein
MISGFYLQRPCLISSGVNIYNPIIEARSIHGLHVITHWYKQTLCHVECTHVVQWYARKYCGRILAWAALSTCLHIGCRPQSLTWYINRTKIKPKKIICNIFITVRKIILNLQNSVLDNMRRSSVRKTRIHIIASSCGPINFKCRNLTLAIQDYRGLHRCAVTEGIHDSSQISLFFKELNRTQTHDKIHHMFKARTGNGILQVSVMLDPWRTDYSILF